MALIALFLMSVGVLGLVWATFGASLATWMIGKALRKDRRVSGSENEVRKFEILVAAHNEEDVIARTLGSLVGAIETTRLTRDCEFSITVGLDHCSDQTRSIVEEFARGCSAVSVRALENPGPAGKWHVLSFLAGKSEADWIAFVDAGSLWDKGFLSAAWGAMSDSSVVGVAPSYMPLSPGILESANWKLEQTLKSLENAAGGPVSVHGATVLYRLATLKRVFEKLKGSEWLNDDVVIPLSLRFDDPDARIVYLSRRDWVSDCGVKSALDVEYRRRRRMVVGNLQWVRHVLLPQWRRSPVVALIASRRVMRLFWAYAALAAALGVCMEIAIGVPNGFFCLVGMGLFGVMAWFASNWIRRLGVAFVSGLRIPRYWSAAVVNKRGVSWV